MSVTLTCARDRMRFPAHCLRCRGAASGCYFVDGVEVPLCASCTSKITITRALWVTSSIGLGLMFTIGVGAFLDAWMRYPELSGLRSMVGFVFALGLLALGIIVSYLCARFGWKRHAERWLPVRERDENQVEGKVTLVFRDAETAHEVAVLSRLTASTNNYRHASQTIGYSPRGSVFVGLVPVLFVAVSIGAGLRWITAEGDVSGHAWEAVLFTLFGVWGPVLFWVFAALLFGSFFVAWCWQRFAPTKNTD